MKGWQMVGRMTLVVSLLAVVALPLWGDQNPRTFNERKVEAKKNPEDPEAGIWVLDFRFKDPRLIPVNIPGRGLKQVWYLWYQISNSPKPGDPPGQPRRLVPDFVWVNHDEDGVFHDEVLPVAQDKIQRLEDPTNLLQIKNSVTIAREDIAVSKEFDEKGNRIAYPRLVTGVATWVMPSAEEIDKKQEKKPSELSATSNRFSIFVYGLSDGWSAVDDPAGTGKTVVRRKTLQLKFKRVGDEFFQTGNEIKYLGYEWVYREAPIADPTLDEDKK